MTPRKLWQSRPQCALIKAALTGLFSVGSLLISQPAQAQLSLRNERVSSDGSFLKTKGLPKAPGKSINPIITNLVGWPWWWPLILGDGKRPKPAVPDAPRNLTISTPEDTSKSFILGVKSKKYEFVTMPQHGTLSEGTDRTTTADWVYTPNDDFNGKDTFTFRIKATGSTSTSTPASKVATASIDVAAVNDTPVARPDSYTTSGSLYVPAAEGVLRNDIDVDGDTLSVVNVLSQPEEGTLIMNEDGSFTYTPVEGASGSVSFTYEISDGQIISEFATVTIYLVPTAD